MNNLPAVIALVATSLLAFDAAASEKPLPFITIAGDFVWDRGDVRYALTEEIRKPVTVQWHAGMRVSDALREAGVRPLHNHVELKFIRAIPIPTSDFNPSSATTGAISS
jgi:hypothetical protein